MLEALVEGSGVEGEGYTIEVEVVRPYDERGFFHQADCPSGQAGVLGLWDGPPHRVGT